MSPCPHNWPRGWPYPGFELEHELPLNLVSSDPKAGAERLFSNCFLSVFPPFYPPISRCFSRRLYCFFLMLFRFWGVFLLYHLAWVRSEVRKRVQKIKQRIICRISSQQQDWMNSYKGWPSSIKNTARSRKERDWSGFMQSTNSL